MSQFRDNQRNERTFKKLDIQTSLIKVIDLQKVTLSSKTLIGGKKFRGRTTADKLSDRFLDLIMKIYLQKNIENIKNEIIVIVICNLAFFLIFAYCGVKSGPKWR